MIISTPVDTSSFETFVFICDGEVADVMKIPHALERQIAVLSSNPIVLKIDSGQSVQIGDLYKDGRFSKP